MSRSSDPRRDEAGTSWARRLLELSTATDRIMQSIFLGDRIGTLREVALQSHVLLRAEACSIFLVEEDSPRWIRKVASHSDLWAQVEASRQPVRLEIRSAPGSGLTGHIADRGEIVRLHGPELTSNVYSAGKPPDHLGSGRCLSLLGIPLKDRKGQLRGLMVVDNKKGPNGEAGGDDFFTDEDVSIAKILASKTMLVLESQRTSEILQGLLTKAQGGSSVSEVLDAILQESLTLLRADRGDLALVDEDTGQLVLMACRGGWDVPIGGAIPHESIMYHVWSTGEPRPIFADVHEDPTYYVGDPRTRSEVAVCLEWEGQRIGVLNAESFRRNCFDEQDVALLRSLAQYAVIAYRAVGRELRFRHAIQRLASSHPPEEVLLDILRSVRSIHLYDGAIIYYADYQERKLVCKSFNTAKPVDREKCQEFSYGFTEKSFATLILNHRQPVFVPSPALDGRVNQKGVEAFKIDGPMAGLPLIFRDRVVGVLVVWAAAGQTPLDESNIGVLEPFARLAAASIAMWSQQGAALQSIEAMLQLIQIEPSLQEKLEGILDLVKSSGFDRVRVFRFDRDTECFRPVASLPKDSPPNFSQCVIPIADNPYARDTYESAHLKPSARIYDQSLFGPDPHAEKLGKPEGLPWVVIPLVIAGKLYGQIVADNADHGHPIPSDSLQHLTLLGTFAALAIANTRVYERQSLSSLHLLYSHFPDDAVELTYIQRLLVYLTSGESLRFSRALYLSLDGHRKRLRYVTGLGSTTQEEFIRVAGIAEREGIERTMAQAGNLRDEMLETAMQDFAIELEEPTIHDMIQRIEARRFTISQQNHDHPAWLEELKRRVEAVDVLAAPVLVDGKLTGLFIVDRQFLNEAISEADRAQLGSFAHHAGVFLNSFSLRQEAINQFRRAVRNETSSSAYHRIKGPVSVIQGKLRLFDVYIESKEIQQAINAVRQIRPEVQSINQIIVDSLHVGEFALEPLPLEPILREALSKAEPIPRSYSCADELQVLGDRRLLTEAFEELVANARHWSPASGGSIEIFAEALPLSDADAGVKHNDYVRILVKNAGTGVPSDRKKWIFGEGNSTREGGNGRGLPRVRDIIQVHGGRIGEIGEYGRFALFEILLRRATPRPSTTKRTPS